MNFRDATLLVLAHGSTVNAESARPARVLAERLQARGLFATAAACYWKQRPGVVERVAAARSSRVFVVPLMTGPGYFVEEVIPAALGFKREGGTSFPRVQQRGPQRVFYTHPVGTSPQVTALLRARALAVMAAHPFPRAPQPGATTLVVAGHGTERSAASRQAVEEHVTRLRRVGEFAEVLPAFLEIEPAVARVPALAAQRQVVIVPLFISDGLHAAEDIPVLLGEPAERVQARLRAGLPPWSNPTERGGKLIWYAPGLGEAPELEEIILERVREAAAWALPETAGA